MLAVTLWLVPDGSAAAQVALVRGVLILAGAHLAGTAVVDRWQTPRRRPRLIRRGRVGS